MPETLVTPTTDLTPFTDVRVKVTRTVPIERGQTTRYTYFGVFHSLWHSADLPHNTSIRRPHCGGMLLEEPHGDCRGGMTGFDLPYNDATIELAA